MKKILLILILALTSGWVKAQFHTAYSYKTPSVQQISIGTWCYNPNTIMITNVDNGGYALESAGAIVCVNCEAWDGNMRLNFNWDEFIWTDNATLYSGGNHYKPHSISLANGDIVYTRSFVKRKDGTVHYGTINSSTVTCEAGGTPVAPTVYTCSGYPEVTPNSAFVCGQVVSQGSSSVTSYGFAYSRNPGISIADSTIAGSGDMYAGFTANITGLAENTTYYFAAYATSNDGTGYGPERSFITGTSCTTMPDVFSVFFPNYSATVTSTTIDVASEATSQCAVTSRGFYYSKTNSNPGPGDNVIYVSNVDGLVVTTATGLTPGTGYYFTAFITNANGTDVITTSFKIYTAFQ